MIPGFNIAAGVSRYRSPAVNFSRADSSYITKNAYWGTTSKLWTASIWFRTDDLTAQQHLFGDSVNGTTIFVNVDERIVINGYSGAAAVLNATSGTNVVLADTWHHLIFSVDLSDSGKRHVYLDDASLPMTWTTYTNSTIQWTIYDWVIGARGSDLSLNWSGDIADFYMDQSYLDLSVEANRRQFISGAKKPVDITDKANVFLYTKGSESAAASTWNNIGSGGTGTHNGVITNSVGSPSD